MPKKTDKPAEALVETDEGIAFVPEPPRQNPSKWRAAKGTPRHFYLGAMVRARQGENPITEAEYDAAIADFLNTSPSGNR